MAIAASVIRQELKALQNPKKAAFFPSFFKTGKGQYGEGDKFLGITVPAQRIVAKKYKDASLVVIEALLKDPYHEVRLTALLILVMQYEKGDSKKQNEIVKFYLSHLKYINNWDLVDSTAPSILGEHLLEAKNFVLLKKLARSTNMWEQRIAMVATYAFIRTHVFDPTIEVATLLIDHSHDLIHKAVGWMLREVGKRDQKVLETFLKKHHKTMPRTALRYAIERFPEKLRKRYLAGKA